jgi:hypothetical protein
MSASRNSKAASKIETRTDAAIAILWALDPNGRHDLSAIDPFTGKIETATFWASQRDAAVAWIEARQGVKNTYTSVNRASTTAPVAIKLAKTDIGTIRAVVLDVDPAKVKGGDPTGENFKRERARLRASTRASTTQLSTNTWRRFSARKIWSTSGPH